ncbi:hypothetical protein [Actinoplanes sp. M2I2]|uniref:hypothetical protein n=1 Tax=Actinoplanes sp. M2I2 TaxID=1734444 RepID=UPI0020213355|nr:hypothetical protein [Actinoplanes sp. M2I2]
MAPDVRLDELTPATTAEPLDLEEGGTAKVSQVTYAGRPYLFKRYHDELRDAVRPQPLRKMLDWRRERSADERAWLHNGAAWVRHLVWEGDRLTGLLVPQAPPDFIAGRQPRTLDTLAHDRPTPVKLNAFGHLIAAVAWFHRRGVVINDLHAYNVLVRATGAGVYLVDCDSMTGEHWEPVLPANLAPDQMRDVIPDVDRPRPEVDYARLAQIIVTTTLDLDVAEIATLDEDATFGSLCRELTEPVALFLCAARTCESGPGAVEEWARLGDLWRQPARAWVRMPDRRPACEGWNPVGGPLLPRTGLPRLPLPEPPRLGGPDVVAASPVRRFPAAEIRSRSWTPPAGSARTRQLVAAIGVAALCLITLLVSVVV